ncbi:hypothetical protein ACOSP7_006415 [Xanthoceras sorbifolium]|uniref:RING-type domain-containing protein n=1 Tax=Xanthoceras sorbifolium TaxID=99658 RepID=A0ABQ8I8Q0_9ROSI|nr:hypothetical protein JRO89_XS03G0051300 [Xanthoceras sorbifolium]
MSTPGLRKFLERDVRRRTVPDLDLNFPPPIENMSPDCTSFHVSSQGLPAELQRGSQLQLRDSVEVIDDDIAIIDRSTFAEAKNNSRRNHSPATDGLREVLNEAGELMNSLSELTELTELATWCSKPRRTPPDEAEDLCIIVGASNKNKLPEKNVLEPPGFSQKPVAEAPAFSCPICIGPLKEATTTKCGHIFCKGCIETAIAAQSKCPTCRQKLGKRGIFRVYLPSIN